MCKAMGFLASMFQTSSALSSAVISLDRYYAIIHCLRYTSWSVWRYTTVLLLLVWGIAIGANLPPLVGWNGICYQKARFSCFIRWESNTEYTVVLMITNSILPLALMLFCYCRIILVAREHANKIKDASGKSIQGASDCHNANTVNASGPVAYAFMAPIKRLSMLSFPSATKSFADPYSEYFNNNALEDGRRECNSSPLSRQLKAITRLVSLLIVFTLAFLPFMGINTKLSVHEWSGEAEPSTNLAVTTTTLLSLIPCALNPLLYAVFSRNFRLAFRRLLKTRVHPDSHTEERKHRNSLQTYAAILSRPRSVSVISDPTYDRSQLGLQTFGSFLSLRGGAALVDMDGDQCAGNSGRPKSSPSNPAPSGQYLQVPEAVVGPVPRLGGDSSPGSSDKDAKPPDGKLNASDRGSIEKDLCKDMERCRLTNVAEGWSEDVKALSDNKANIKIQLDLV